MNNDKEETSLDKLKSEKYTKNLNNSNNDPTNSINSFNNNSHDSNNNTTNSANDIYNNKSINNSNDNSNNNDNLKENYDIKTIEEEIERIDRIQEIKINLKTEIYYNLKILSLKTKKSYLIKSKGWKPNCRIILSNSHV
ncbi:hypothetical protein [Methanobrevibacter arboriphilus]|uniref:hypothetical protein n=1 Tax=Methanobrevibacter arboriphilus TaxID=39441 RepID=UPI000AD5DF46|nr:hypothetical protein [Methanobrevibacter arboriphilus]